ncbi:hypothetical protein O6H91_02G004200 [Diphasiastrum complanatum]|uniref:Uncharacterized protein n=2 Tax=Diphasiastrum complanatum TaxID=34168 RepID=A0ACC2ECI1_DIPCM|nr:hypothetical protein O6H91_02G004200 [Diphasiastrum complanatum]KAJ7564141.1 hypothetical protein O6H91_02G004200 [Diphasiastrum complanatum]
MASMTFDHSRTGEFSVNTRISGSETSSKDGRSVAAAFPLSTNTSDSVVSGIFSNVDASAGRSAFSCANESRMEQATRSDVSSPAQENTRDGEATLTEHDYIGLSEAAASASSERTLTSGVRVNQGGIPDLNLGETELRLGPPKAFHPSRDPSNECPFPGGDMEPFQGNRDDEKQNIAASCEQISCRGEGVVSRFSDGAAADRPQVVVTGAKRVFAEVISSQFAEESTSAAQSAPIDTVSSRSTTDSETKHMRSRLMPPAYPWGLMNEMPSSSSRPMDLDQSRASFQPFPSAMSVQEQQKYITSGGGASSSLNDSDTNPWDTCGMRMSDTSCGIESASYGREDGQDMPEDDSENAPASSSPVVGWPPVQSFRNKALATQPQPKSTHESQALPPAATSPAPQGSTLIDSFFVKVYMDGVSIGRKVDLKSSNSYEKLSLVLEEMFRRLISGNGRAQRSLTGSIALVKENKQRNFIYGSHQYVLTYEDKDGDLMLVGDVPWSMFIGTVKRLRIMKGSDAIGLAPKACEKGSHQIQTLINS